MATAAVKSKVKKAKDAASATPLRKSSRISEQGNKRKATEDVSPSSIKKVKKVEGVKEVEKKEVKTKKAKKENVVKEVEEPEVEEVVEKKEKTKKAKKAKVTKVTKTKEETEEAVVETVAEPVGEPEEAPAEEPAEEDDATTKALVQDLDSEDEDGGASLFRPGQDVGKAPVKAGAGATKRKIKDAETAAAVPGAVVYVGRIPHGFFEHEMRSYFSQFGDIRRLRLSRNRRTGASKHYAFIEFCDADVASIVAQTMDNYLLFGHILRCSVVSPDRVPPNLFVGADRRFKAVPWNRMAARQLALPKPAAQWEAKIGAETKRRAKRSKRLQETMGYTYEAPALKAPEPVAAEAVETEEPKVIEEAIEADKQEPKAEETPVVVKPAKKSKKSKA